MASPFASFQDLRDRTNELGYSAGSAADLIKALDRAVKLYDHLPLTRIPVDLAAFDRRWAERTDTIMLGFKSPDAFAKWRSCIRGALKRALGLKVPPTATPTNDPWATVLAYVEANSGPTKIFPTNRQLTLVVIAERARLTGRLSPAQLDAEWVRQQDAALHYGRRKVFRRAVAFLNILAAERNAHPAIAGLLPTTPLARPLPQRGRPFGGAILPASFHADLDAFLAWYPTRKCDPKFAADTPEARGAPSSIVAYRSALSWLVREVVEGEILPPAEITGLAAVCNVDTIRLAAYAFSVRRAAEDSVLKKGASSLHAYAAKAAFVTRHWIKADEDECTALTALLREPAIRTSQVGRIAAERETFIRRLDRDSALQKAILMLPDTLMQVADVLLVRWPSLRRGARMQTLRLALAATQAAFLLRTMPVRATNLRTMRFRGPSATLLLPKRRGEAMAFDIPAADVKNHRHLDGPVAVLTEPFLQRWLDAYRPLYVYEHPFDAPIRDSDFLFPGTSREAAMDASVFAQAFTLGMSHAGLDLTLHECRHAVATLALKEDRTRLQIVADWLGDSVATVERYYSFLNTSAAARVSQGHMAELVRNAHRAQRRA